VKIHYSTRVLVSLAAVSVLVGCTAPAIPSEPATPSSSPTASPTPTELPGAIPESDVIPGATVTDELGPYVQMTIEPNHPSLEYNADLVDQKVFDAGWTEDDLTSVQDFVMRFVVEQALDSSALDRGETGWNEWWDSEGVEYVDADATEKLRSRLGDMGIVVNNYPHEHVPSDFPQLTRDGTPRIDGASSEITSIFGGVDEFGDPYVWVEGTSDVNYRTTDELMLPWLLERYDSDDMDVVETGFPAYFDGEPDIFHVDLRWLYAIARDGDNWKIISILNESSTDLLSPS
jgi:hypothetical protein